MLTRIENIIGYTLLFLVIVGYAMAFQTPT